MHVVPSDTADLLIVTRALCFVGTVHVTMISGKTAVPYAPEMETFLVSVTRVHAGGPTPRTLSGFGTPMLNVNPPPTINPAEINNRRRLFCAVIFQALEDARGDSTDLNTPTARECAIQQARRWLTVPNRDFNTTCHLADLHPERVRAEAKRLIAEADQGIVQLNSPLMKWLLRLGDGRSPS